MGLTDCVLWDSSAESNCGYRWLPKARLHICMLSYLYAPRACSTCGMLSFADAMLMQMLYRSSILSNNFRDSVKIEMWDGPAPNSRHTFFQNSLLSGMGVDDALSFVTSLGASLAAACCWAVGSGAFVFCLVICGSWVEGTFLSDFTEVTGCCSVL